LIDLPKQKPTPRELEVIHLVSHGFERKEIAHDLRISVKTVEAHVFNLRRKIGARNSVHALRLLIQSGHVDLIAA